MPFFIELGEGTSEHAPLRATCP